MKNWYKSLEGRYSTFPKDVQVLNLVSDLVKAQTMREVDREASNNNLLRALILLDYMIDDVKWRSGLRELLRLRETIASVYAGMEYAPLETVITAAAALDRQAYRRWKGL